MATNEVIDVSVSLQNSVVLAADFGVPLILGSSNRFGGDRFRVYSGATGLTAMVADGFLTTDPEYLEAQALLGQVNTVATFLVGNRLSPVAQVQQITITAPVNGHIYTAQITDIRTGGTCSGSFTAVDTVAANVATGLSAALATALGGAPTVGVGSGASGAHVNLTASLAGSPFLVVLGGTGLGEMAQVTTVANHGVAEDLADIRAASASWYETIPASRVTSDLELSSAWTEANQTPPTIQGVQTSEATTGSNAVNAALTDLGNVLKAKGYKRTFWLFHGNDAECGMSAWSGRQLPLTPGTENWALKSLVGITPDALTDTVKANIMGVGPGPGGKFGNTYRAITSVNNVTLRGTMASGDWVDVIRFLDFLKARIGEAGLQVFLSLEKIEFDDTGLGLIGAAVTGVFRGLAKGTLAPTADLPLGYRVIVPAASSFSTFNRQNRILSPGITFRAQLSGALNYAQISGTVTE